MAEDQTQTTIAQGQRKDWVVTLRREADLTVVKSTDPDGLPVGTGFSLTVYPGPGREPYTLADSTFEELDLTQGTCTLTLGESDSSTFEPGRNYWFASLAADPGVRVAEGWFAVTRGAGITADGHARASLQDLVRYGGQLVNQLIQQDESGDFQELRERATSEFDLLVHRHRQWPGVSFPSVQYPQGIANTQGYVDPWLQGFLDSDWISPLGVVREIEARWALAWLCERQITGTEGDPYPAAVRRHRARAQELVYQTTVQVYDKAPTSSTYPILLVALNATRVVRAEAWGRRPWSY